MASRSPRPHLPCEYRFDTESSVSLCFRPTLPTSPSVGNHLGLHALIWMLMREFLCIKRCLGMEEMKWRHASYCAKYLKELILQRSQFDLLSIMQRPVPKPVRTYCGGEAAKRPAMKPYDKFKDQGPFRPRMRKSDGPPSKVLHVYKLRQSTTEDEVHLRVLNAQAKILLDACAFRAVWRGHSRHSLQATVRVRDLQVGVGCAGRKACTGLAEVSFHYTKPSTLFYSLGRIRTDRTSTLCCEPSSSRVAMARRSVTVPSTSFASTSSIPRCPYLNRCPSRIPSSDTVHLCLRFCVRSSRIH